MLVPSGHTIIPTDPRQMPQETAIRHNFSEKQLDTFINPVLSFVLLLNKIKIDVSRVPRIMTTNETCRLCDRKGILQESHIIPKFVARWLKNSSATGYLRATPTPNRRSQDGVKVPLLCANCEGRFNQWETEVADRIFYPFNKNRPKSLPYGPWFLKFAVSVSWRSLTYYLDMTKDAPEYSRPALDLMEKALKTWKEFIFDLRPHPDVFEQHLILFDAIESMKNTHGLPPNMNRFLIRGMHINLAHSQGYPSFIFTKMGRMALFGFIGMKHLGRWKGTKIHVDHGHIGGNIAVPSQLLDYLKERARVVQQEYDGISPKQKEIIAETLKRDPGRTAASETFEALDHDVRLFGQEAFSKSEGEREMES